MMDARKRAWLRRSGLLGLHLLVTIGLRKSRRHRLEVEAMIGIGRVPQIDGLELVEGLQVSQPRDALMQLTGGQALARQLVAEGVTDLFGIPGVRRRRIGRWSTRKTSAATTRWTRPPAGCSGMACLMRNLQAPPPHAIGRMPVIARRG
jgi:hypothetical protein